MKGFNYVLSASTLAIAASFAATDAGALNKARYLQTNPTGICQAALPAFEGAIRKRPLAVQNEGGANAFITCSFTSQGLISQVRVYFSSNDGEPHDISCTGVSGYNNGMNQYIVKNIVLGNGSIVSEVWDDIDFIGGNFPSSKFSISCNLPPGAGINLSRLTTHEDVGN